MYCSNDDPHLDGIRTVEKPSYAKEFAKPSRKNEASPNISTASSSQSSDRQIRNRRKFSADKPHYNELSEGDDEMNFGQGDDYCPKFSDESTDKGIDLDLGDEHETSGSGRIGGFKSKKTDGNKERLILIYLILILEPFYNCTLEASKSTSGAATVCLVFQLISLHQHLSDWEKKAQNEKDENLTRILISLKANLIQKVNICLKMLIAVLLDPFMKDAKCFQDYLAKRQIDSFDLLYKYVEKFKNSDQWKILLQILQNRFELISTQILILQRLLSIIGRLTLEYCQNFPKSFFQCHFLVFQLKEALVLPEM